MEQLRQTNSQKINLNQILKVKKTLLDLKRESNLKKMTTHSKHKKPF